MELRVALRMECKRRSMGRIHLDTFRVLVHQSGQMIDLPIIMRHMQTCKLCVVEKSLEYMSKTTLPYTMEFKEDGIHVKLAANERSGFIVEKRDGRFEPVDIHENGEAFVQCVLTKHELAMIDITLRSGHILSGLFYAVWMQACRAGNDQAQHKLLLWMEKIMKDEESLRQEILLPLRSMSYDEEVAKRFEFITQKHGIDLVTFDVETF